MVQYEKLAVDNRIGFESAIPAVQKGFTKLFQPCRLPSLPDEKAYGSSGPSFQHVHTKRRQ